MYESAFEVPSNKHCRSCSPNTLVRYFTDKNEPPVFVTKSDTKLK